MGLAVLDSTSLQYIGLTGSSFVEQDQGSASCSASKLSRSRVVAVRPKPREGQAQLRRQAWKGEDLG